jgi:hypothetical protein
MGCSAGGYDCSERLDWEGEEDLISILIIDEMHDFVVYTPHDSHTVHKSRPLSLSLTISLEFSPPHSSANVHQPISKPSAPQSLS